MHDSTTVKFHFFFVTKISFGQPIKRLLFRSPRFKLPFKLQKYCSRLDSNSYAGFPLWNDERSVESTCWSPPRYLHSAEVISGNLSLQYPRTYCNRKPFLPSLILAFTSRQLFVSRITRRNFRLKSINQSTQPTHVDSEWRWQRRATSPQISRENQVACHTRAMTNSKF